MLQYKLQIIFIRDIQVNVYAFTLWEKWKPLVPILAPFWSVDGVLRPRCHLPVRPAGWGGGADAIFNSELLRAGLLPPKNAFPKMFKIFTCVVHYTIFTTH